MHSVVRLKKKRGEKAIIRTQKSATAQETTKCVGLCAKMTFTADEEDDKSIYNHRDDAEEPAENPKHGFH